MSTLARGAPRAGEAHGSDPARPSWQDAATLLYDWMRTREFRGHDPHDALASPMLSQLSFGSRWLGVAWTQLGKRTPPAWRAAAGVRTATNPKAIGLTLAAAVRLSRAGASPRWSAEAAAHRQRLAESAVRSGAGAGWGYPFPWANRDFFAPAGTPSGVATAFIGHALLDAADSLGDEAAAELAADAATFIQRRLRRVPLGDGFAFSYTPLDTRVVHNANALAASLIARVGARLGDVGMLDDARAAARASARAQRPDGSWTYGEGRRNAWVDSFHTSYLLAALEQVRAAAGCTDLDPLIQRGVDYWLTAFSSGPAIGYSPGRAYPVDMHAVAHTVVTLRALEYRIPEAKQRAERLGRWSLDAMRDADGSFYYRCTAPGRVNRARYMRWTQAWMLLALAELAAWQ